MTTLVAFLIGLFAGTFIGACGVCVTLYWLGRIAARSAAAEAVAQFSERLKASQDALRAAPTTAVSRWHVGGWMH